MAEKKIAKVDPNAALRKNSEKRKSEDTAEVIAARAAKSAGAEGDENANPNVEEGWLRFHMP